MSDPRRWLEGEGSSLELSLLRAARADAPPAGAKKRALAALGLASPTEDAPQAKAQRAPALCKPQGRALMFASVLGPDDRGAGPFGLSHAGLTTLAALAAAGAVLLAMPPPSRPAAPAGIEVALAYSSPSAPKSEEPAVVPAPPPKRRPDMTVRSSGPSPAPPQVAATKAEDLLEPPDSHAQAPSVAPPIAAIERPEKAVPAVPEAIASSVLAFENEMTKPVLISGRDPVYTREALTARVEGSVSVKCTITTEGTLAGCRVLQSVPHMDKAVLDAMATRRYRPVTYQGRPVAVDYVFTIRLVLPK
jgi:TonB family protein